MAKKKDKAFSKVAETAKESDAMRMLRIDGSQNGATLRTRVVRDKDAGDFPFLWGAVVCE